MKWSSEKPHEPGWYWARWQNHIEITYVYDYKGELACQWVGNNGAYFVEDEREVEEWAGPIPEPKENDHANNTM